MEPPIRPKAALGLSSGPLVRSGLGFHYVTTMLQGIIRYKSPGPQRSVHASPTAAGYTCDARGRRWAAGECFFNQAFSMKRSAHNHTY